MVKNPPTMQVTWVQSLGWEDPLEKAVATHSSILAWRIPCLYSPWGHKELDMTEQLSRSLLISSDPPRLAKAQVWSFLTVVSISQYFPIS